MHAISVLVIASTLGVDFGWQKTADGQWEYIVQIEPALLQSLADGESIVSTMPAEMDGVRRVVLRVGTDPVPKDRLPEIRMMAGTSVDGVGNPSSSSLSMPREIVDDWATRPRIDIIPFAERERSRLGTGRSGINGSTRSGQLSRQRTMPLPPDEEWRTADESRPIRTSPSINSSIGRSSIHRSSPFDEPSERFDPVDSRNDRTARRNDRNSFAETATPRTPPKASITESKGEANRPSAPQRATLQSSGSVTVISLFLFMSLGGNLYLGWLARDFYWRYRDIAWEIRNNQTAANPNPD